MTEAGTPTSTTPITLEVSQDPELSVRAPGDGMHAFLELRLHDVDRSLLGGAPAAAEVIIIDCSGSMTSPRTKIDAAREAANAAIDALRDGTAFAVVKGTHRAAMVYPPHEERLEIADHDSRARARSRVRHVLAEGGTAIGSWLALARRLLADSPADIRHAVLLTDGRNVSSHGLLSDELARCEGRFVCDARGIGEDWDARELMRIADRLHGTADASLHDADLVAEFRDSVCASMERTLAGLTLRISLHPGTRLRYLKQSSPTQRDLTPNLRRVDERTVELTTQPWASTETRHYHLCLDVDPRNRPLHENIQVAWLEVDGGSDRLPPPAPVPVLVHWIPGQKLSTLVSELGESILLHEDLGLAIGRGYDAYHAEDRATAQAELAKAVRIAERLGHAEIRARLAQVVDVDDATGGVRLKEKVDTRLLARLLLISRESTVEPVTDPPPAPDPAAPPAELIQCPNCDTWGPATANFCIKCPAEFANSRAAESGPS